MSKTVLLSSYPPFWVSHRTFLIQNPFIGSSSPVLSGNARDQTQDLPHAKQMSYHWATALLKQRHLVGNSENKLERSLAWSNLVLLNVRSMVLWKVPVQSRKHWGGWDGDQTMKLLQLPPHSWEDFSLNKVDLLPTLHQKMPRWNTGVWIKNNSHKTHTHNLNPTCKCSKISGDKNKLNPNS